MKQNALDMRNRTALRLVSGSRKKNEADVIPFAVPQFRLRSNANGSFDVICMKCFLTAGNGSQKADIETIQKRHECDPSLLVDLKYYCSTC